MLRVTAEPASWAARQGWSCLEHRQNQGNTLFLRARVRLEQNEFAVVLDHAPAAAGLNQRSKRRVYRTQNRVEPIMFEQRAPPRPAIADRQVLVSDLFSVIVVAAVEEHLLAGKI